MKWVWGILAALMVLCCIVCIPIQHRALNRIAFGRSMFITFALILFGLFMVVVATNVAAVILGALLVVIGYGFMILVAVKSYQRLQGAKR
jgi:ABC-type multidrug transport system fused ATPase/permease subunit